MLPLSKAAGPVSVPLNHSWLCLCTALFSKKDWTPSHCYLWILAALPSLKFFLLNNETNNLLSYIFCLFDSLFFFYWTEKCDYSLSWSKLCEITKSHGYTRHRNAVQFSPRLKGCLVQSCKELSSSNAASSVGLCVTCWQIAPKKSCQYHLLPADDSCESCAFLNPEDCVFRCSEDNNNTALVMQLLAASSNVDEGCYPNFVPPLSFPNFGISENLYSSS